MREISARIENGAPARWRERALDAAPKLLFHERQRFTPAPRMPDWIFDQHFARGAAVAEFDAHRVRVAALACIVKVPRQPFVFRDDHLRAQRVDARIGCGFVLVIRRRELAVEQHESGNVLHAMIAARRIVQRPDLVRALHGLSMSSHANALYLIDAVLDEWMEPERAF